MEEDKWCLAPVPRCTALCCVCLLPAAEKCLLAPLPDTGRRYQPCLALSTGNEPPGTVLSVYDKDINNTVL